MSAVVIALCYLGFGRFRKKNYGQKSSLLNKPNDRARVPSNSPVDFQVWCHFCYLIYSLAIVHYTCTIDRRVTTKDLTVHNREDIFNTFSSARANAASGLPADPSGLLRIYGQGWKMGHVIFKKEKNTCKSFDARSFKEPR